MQEVKILLGDCRELIDTIPSDSIDMIMTDPPYVEKDIHLLWWMNRDLPRVLKPGGFLMFYIGNYFLQRAMEAITNLNYYWMCASMTPDARPMHFSRRVFNGFKPVLIYSKGPARPRQPFNDVFTGVRNKRWHIWGQSEELTRYYLELLTFPGAHILDPFSGGGTTAYVCSQIDRRCTAFELDPAAYDSSVKRLEVIQKLLISHEEIERSQLELGI